MTASNGGRMPLVEDALRCLRGYVYKPSGRVYSDLDALSAIAALEQRVRELEGALYPYVEKAAPHEQLFSGEDLRNYQRAEKALYGS